MSRSRVGHRRSVDRQGVRVDVGGERADLHAPQPVVILGHRLLGQVPQPLDGNGLRLGRQDPEGNPAVGMHFGGDDLGLGGAGEAGADDARRPRRRADPKEQPKRNGIRREGFAEPRCERRAGPSTSLRVGRRTASPGDRLTRRGEHVQVCWVRPLPMSPTSAPSNSPRSGSPGRFSLEQTLRTCWIGTVDTFHGEPTSPTAPWRLLGVANQVVIFFVVAFNFIGIGGHERFLSSPTTSAPATGSGADRDRDQRHRGQHLARRGLSSAAVYFLARPMLHSMQLPANLEGLRLDFLP